MLIKWVESLVGPVDNFRLIWDLNAILIKNLIYLLYIHLIQVIQINTFQQFLLLLGNVCEILLFGQSLQQLYLFYRQLDFISILIH